MKRYILKNLIAWDMTICALHPKSEERETISGFLARVYPNSIAKKVVDYIFYKCKFWPDDDHCEDVAEKEESFIE